MNHLTANLPLPKDAPELLYEIYKYLLKRDYITLKGIRCTQIDHLVEAFRDTLEARMIYSQRKPTTDLMRGVEYIAKTNPNYTWCGGRCRNMDYGCSDHLITWGVHNRQYKIVKLLLVRPNNLWPKRYPKYPSNRLTRAFIIALARGYIEIAKMLLADNRVDASYEYRYVFCVSARKGYFEIMKLMLAKKRIRKEMTDEQLDMITYALEKGYSDSIKRLVRKCRKCI